MLAVPFHYGATVRSRTAAYYHRSPPKAALRELLSATLEWVGGDAPPRELLVGSTRFRLSHLADGAAGAAAILCEPPPGVAIPEYHERRAIRSRVSGRMSRHLVIFTDAAHSSLVWTWETRGHLSTRLYRELSFRPGQAWGPLRPVLESIAAGPEIAPEREVAARGPCRAPEQPAKVESPHRIDPGTLLHSAIAMALGDNGDAAIRTRAAQRIQDLIEESAGAAAIREFWQTLMKIRVLDPACGKGGWLLHASGTLAAAYEAVLERMQSEVDDLERQRQPARSDRLGDLRRLMRRAGGRRGPPARGRFALELALLHNIFGMDASPHLAQECRRKLTEALGSLADPALLSLNVRVGPATSTAPPPELLRRGAAAIRSAHIRQEIELAELSRAFAAAERFLPPRSEPLMPRGYLVERSVGGAAPCGHT